MAVAIYRNCLQTEIRFSDLMGHDICIGGEFAGECRALKTGPKTKAADALARLRFSRSRGLEPGLLAPVSEIRRRISLGPPSFRGFQRPSRFFRPDGPHSAPTGRASERELECQEIRISPCRRK